eukprot:jgi/Psemu1/25994/gm1.25994_g
MPGQGMRFEMDIMQGMTFEKGILCDTNWWQSTYGGRGVQYLHAEAKLVLEPTPVRKGERVALWWLLLLEEEQEMQWHSRLLLRRVNDKDNNSKKDGSRDAMDVSDNGSHGAISSSAHNIDTTNSAHNADTTNIAP